MKITIQHRDDGKGCLFTMDDEIRVSLEALGSRSIEMIKTQDPLLWSKASDTGLLKIIEEGAFVLRCIGVHTITPLSDANAHRAFVTCCLLALRVGHLSSSDRRTLRRAIVILAECCTVKIDRAIVPPMIWLPKKVKTVSRLALTYRKLLGNEPVSLADLLRLSKHLESALTPSFVVIGCELRTITEGLRAALELTQTRRGSSVKRR